MKTKLTAMIASLATLWVAFTAMLATTTIVFGQTPPPNMALIPAGAFQMGDTFNEGYVEELPVHEVYVSSFYIGKYDVTKKLWDEVYEWAIKHNYIFNSLIPATGRALDHPIQNVTWYDAVKWCNARSEKEGRVPAYYTSATQITVYRSGQIDLRNDWVKWDAGYRLPTEAEWEKAARGGLTGKRFPWGNTISHNQANYDSSASYFYDVGPTRGFHPVFGNGINLPFSSPVGYFAANGYGLYDTTGNTWQWCWDWNGPYPNSTVINPRGENSGSGRIVRGGSAIFTANFCRVAFRGKPSPNYQDYEFGFRTVLSVESVMADEIGKISTPTKPVYSTPPQIESGKDSLVVVTHGWINKILNPIHPPNPDWVDDMTNSITKYLLANGLNNWQVHAHKWVNNAYTFSPDTARDNGKKEGVNLGKDLASKNWKHIHFVGHSAGAALIQAASETVKSFPPPIPVVHTTFLDAFVGLDYEEKEKYGNGADWSDSYFSRDLETFGSGLFEFTESPLDYAHNVDITFLDSHKEPVRVSYSTSSGDISETCYQTVSSHSWPYQFYTNTIPPNSVFGANGFGFTLSKEGGNANWNSVKTDYPAGNSPPRVLGSGELSCVPNASKLTVSALSSVNFQVPPLITSPNGLVQNNGSGLVLTTILPPPKLKDDSISFVWLSVSLTITNAVNFVSLEAEFANSGTNGLLSVFWDTNVIGSIDERVALPGFRQYTFPLPGTISSGSRMFSLRLDSFETNANSSVTITNVALGFGGIKDPFSLSFTGTRNNDLPVLQLVGPSGFNYTVESSTNLIDWKAFIILVNTNGVVRFVDADSTNSPTHFYRALGP